ncbi:conserved hypothetical protein [Ricinus communis]|uniref:Uncharacterized protein n=1 Tax=Ricinus communis TaxID=3988 RepID=B9SXB4_RICCO|nr:conserved hypothetical protein [Ricinus communis]
MHTVKVILVENSNRTTIQLRLNVSMGGRMECCLKDYYHVKSVVKLPREEGMSSKK